MRTRFAPSHDLVARMVFVPPSDSAWRNAVIDAECREMSKHVPEDDRPAVYMHAETGHPFWRYWVGHTRFDIDATELQPYLDRSQMPEMWHFRRLTLDERAHCRVLERADRVEDARQYAFACAVTAVDGASGETGRALVEALAAKRDHAAILKAAENYSAASVQEVGAACLRGSQDLTPIEKKA